MDPRSWQARRRAAGSRSLSRPVLVPAVALALVAGFAAVLPTAAGAAAAPTSSASASSGQPSSSSSTPPANAGKPVFGTSVTPTTARADDGAYVVKQNVIDSRTVDIVINSPALKTTAGVRVFLPPAFFSDPGATWPTLYLLPGANEPYDYQAWDHFTNIKKFTANQPILVAMPSDGMGGFFTDWVGGKKYGYETFHTKELPQILARGFRAGAKRAVAGISIGGFGAMSYAGRHPGFYGAAASFSGFLHTTTAFTGPASVGLIVLNAKMSPNDLWGDSFFNAANWHAHDPYYLASKLKGTSLFVSNGNGLPGPLDKAWTFDLLDAGTQSNSQDFVGQLKKYGVPVTADFYGNGTHSWPYWQREFPKAWPTLAAGLGLPKT